MSSYVGRHRVRGSDVSGRGVRVAQAGMVAVVSAGLLTAGVDAAVAEPAPPTGPFGVPSRVDAGWEPDFTTPRPWDPAGVATPSMPSRPGGGGERAGDAWSPSPSSPVPSPPVPPSSMSSPSSSLPSSAPSPPGDDTDAPGGASDPSHPAHAEADPRPPEAADRSDGTPDPSPDAPGTPPSAPAHTASPRPPLEAPGTSKNGIDRPAEPSSTAQPNTDPPVEPAPEPKVEPTPTAKPTPKPAAEPKPSAKPKSASTSAPEADESSSAKQGTARVLGIASGLSGIPYVWGGTSTRGFDCSGFTQHVFGKAGVDLPRTAAQQQRAVRRVRSPRPGDLVFFGSPAHHVGIYAGKGKMYDAPRRGKTTGLHTIWSRDVTYGRP